MKRELTKEELDAAEAAYAKQIYANRHKIERGARKMLRKLPDKPRK